MDYVEHKLTQFSNAVQTFFTSALYKTALLCTFVFSILANAFAYVNLYPQHDSLNHMFEFAGTWEISLGRFMLPVYGLFQGQITTPWLIGVLSILYISLIVYIICDLFDFDHTWQIAIVSAVLSANLAITELASVYLYVLAAYCLSALFSCAGVYVLIKQKSALRYFFAVIFFTLSLGMYQAEIAFGITLLAIVAVKDLLESCKVSEVILKYLKIAVTLACSAVVYYATYKLLLAGFHLEAPNTYSNISNIAKISFEELLTSVKGCYLSLFNYFWGKNGFVGIPVTQVSNSLLTLIAVLSLLVYFFKNKHSWAACSLVLLILAVLPIVVCLVNVLMTDSQFVFHRVYSLYLVYVLLLYIITYCTRSWVQHPAVLRTVVITCCFLITVQNVVFSNQVYSNQKIMYDRSVSIVGRILEDVESVPDYEIGGTEVILIGELQKNTLLKNLTRIDSKLPGDIQKNQGLRKMLNHSSLRGGKVLSVTYTMTFDSFTWLLGSELYRAPDDAVIKEYTSMEEVVNMPAYPRDGYYQMINGRMVIKLS